jgi:TatD DNase family protein
MFVDSHCHLNYKGLVEQQADVLARARSSGVSAMLNISTRESEWDEVIGLAEQENDIWASGEPGLDYYYDKSDRAQQRSSFREHIVAARETGLPIIVHTRDAEDDTAQILSEEMALGTYTGVIHCFTASADFARNALDLGLYISLSGIVTFKNAADLQGVAKWLPADRMLVETDAPFLAPVPHRGRTGEPGFVADTARFVANLRGEGEDALAAQTTANFYRLFSKAIQ